MDIDPNFRQENVVSGRVVAAAVEVHKTLGGPGLLESVYAEALEWELKARGCRVEREKPVPIQYKGQTLSTPLRLDMLIDDLVIVECKATTQFNDVFKAQTLTYLRLTGLRLGVIVNFGEKLVKRGIYRMVNKL